LSLHPRTTVTGTKGNDTMRKTLKKIGKACLILVCVGVVVDFLAWDVSRSANPAGSATELILMILASIGVFIDIIVADWQQGPMDAKNM